MSTSSEKSKAGSEHALRDGLLMVGGAAAVISWIVWYGTPTAPERSSTTPQSTVSDERPRWTSYDDCIADAQSSTLNTNAEAYAQMDYCDSLFGY